MAVILIYNGFFQLPSKEFIREFVATSDLAYSELAITPLSGSDKVRQRNGKHFTNQQLMNVLDELGSHRIPFFLYFSLNLPGESKKAFQQTLALVQVACEAYPPDRLRMINMYHTVDPCCPMSQSWASAAGLAYM